MEKETHCIPYSNDFTDVDLSDAIHEAIDVEDPQPVKPTCTKTATETRRNPAANSRRKMLGQIFTYNRDSAIHAARVGTALVIASIWVLAIPRSHKWNESVWFSITAVIISWLPALDTATAAKKILDRTIGTLIGCTLGLIVGFLSLLFSEPYWRQAIFLGFAAGFIGYAYPYVADRLGCRTAYPGPLGLLTFGIVWVSFYDAGPDTPWKNGVYRVMNVEIGCLLSGLMPFILWPISTTSMIEQNVEKQLQHTGESAKLVLEQAYESFVTGTTPPLIRACLHKEIKYVDDTHKAYMVAVENWKACRGLLPRLKYDPFFLISASKEEREQFTVSKYALLSRIFRIEMNIVMLDSMQRAGVHSGTNMESASLQVLRKAGESIALVLDLARSVEDRNNAARYLLDMLPEVRRLTKSFGQTELQQQQPREIDEVDDLLSRAHGLQHSVVFFQLVEYLILRVCQLHRVNTEDNKEANATK